MDHATIIFNFIKLLFTPVTKSLKWLYDKLPFRIAWKKRVLPLGVIESPWRNHMWSYGKQGDNEVIIINTFWKLTNTLPYNITAMNVFLTKPVRVKGSYLVKDTQSEMFGWYTIPKGYTTEADFNFILDKKYAKNAQDKIKLEIEIQDAIGKLHSVKNVIISPVPQPLIKKKEALKAEDMSLIKNGTIKQVVAVLQNEIPQYRLRGRAQGKLGTVDWPRGAIEWTPLGDKKQYLFGESKKEHVTSEYVNALVKLYNESPKPQQKLIITSLLERIDKKSEYRDIGYLIVFFFFEIHQLHVCLPVFLKKLQGDKANAFSDVLRMLDFLLAFRYEEFSNEELDEIERFVHSTKEHPFEIRERINAIRVKSMLDTKVKVLPALVS